MRGKYSEGWTPVFDESSQVRSQNALPVASIHQNAHHTNRRLSTLERRRRVMPRVLAVILMTFPFNMITLADVIHVPEDYSTIQSGIDASDDGDTVLVAPGEYFERINFRGKAILLTSYYMLDQDLAYITDTIINGTRFRDTNPSQASVVTLRSGEDTDSVLNGFTITGGTGTTYTSEWSRRAGGGVLILSGATITNNHIIDNVVQGNPNQADGGGIHVNSSSPDTIIISNNLIQNNVASGRTLVTGAGMALWGNADVVISKNTFAGNRAESSNPVEGGSGGGALYTNDQTPLIVDNVFARNEAPFGGAINAYGRKTGSNLRLINNTIVDNVASIKGGGIYVNNGHCTAINNIFWGNTAPVDPDIYYRGNLNISYSITQGIFPGPGNMQTDPLFEADTYLLSDASPAIDAGNPDPNFHDTEDPEHPGVPLRPAQGSRRADMGAFGGNENVNVEMEAYQVRENLLFRQYRNMHYRFAYPLDYDSSSLYPLTVVLHGGANWGSDNQEQLFEGLPWRANAEYFGYNEFTVVPQAPNSAGWHSDDNLITVYDLIRDTIDNFPIDTTRIVITGWSMGGGGTWRMLSLYPQLFAAGIPISGTDRGFGDITHIPVWVNHGSADGSVSVSVSRNYIARFEDAGLAVAYAETLTDDEISEAIDNDVRVFYSEFAGAGHIIVKPAYDNGHLFEWLKRQSRP